MSDKKTEIISEDTARSMGNFTEEEIQRAKQRDDGYLMTLGDTRYYLTIQYNDLRTGAKTVEMPDMVGEGKNRLNHRGSMINKDR